MKRNPNIGRLKASYLFPEIHGRKNQFLAKNPNASLISLGIGDTTEPLPPSVAKTLSTSAERLGTSGGYTGYGPEQGIHALREKISQRIYGGKVSPQEVFISDGAKCDLGRLQMLFGGDVSIAVQDPAYPVYLEGSLIQGVQEIISMPCTPENQFFPDLAKIGRPDLLYFCSPNNPTGAVASRKQLEELVQFAKELRSILLFDAAYSNYIQDPTLPKSIYEIEGAKEVAIEIGSFSKLAGFTGVRLGWSVIPEALLYEDGSSVRADWNRLTSTIFNGASNIAQQGGIAVLEEEGWNETLALTQFYLKNVQIIKSAMSAIGYEVYGGENGPYLWVRCKGEKSWDLFQKFLEKYHIVITPGIGFGAHSDEFIRLTAFGHRENIEKAALRLIQGYP